MQGKKTKKTKKTRKKHVFSRKKHEMKKTFFFITLATAQPPPYIQGAPPFYYDTEEPPYFRGQRRSDRRPLRCFLCDEEGHFAYRCPARTLLQRLLRQQAKEQARRPPRGQVLELPAADGSPSSSAVHLN